MTQTPPKAKEGIEVYKMSIDDVEHILANVALNGSYTDSGQTVLSTEIMVNAKAQLETIIKEARINENQRAVNLAYHNSASKYDRKLFQIMVERIAELKGKE